MDHLIVLSKETIKLQCPIITHSFLSHLDLNEANEHSCIFTLVELLWLTFFFQGNSVSTTKYDVLTFLPKGLFEQVFYLK